MCRKVVFKGSCPQCANNFIWDELSQKLSCLEAKNNGVFGMCKEGTLVDEKSHDQECDPCLAAMEADEGYDGGTDFDAAGAYDPSGGYYYDHKKAAADRDQASGKPKHKKQRTT